VQANPETQLAVVAGRLFPNRIELGGDGRRGLAPREVHVGVACRDLERRFGGPTEEDLRARARGNDPGVLDAQMLAVECDRLALPQRLEHRADVRRPLVALAVGAAPLRPDGVAEAEVGAGIAVRRQEPMWSDRHQR
jgi:hypothetical protein